MGDTISFIVWSNLSPSKTGKVLVEEMSEGLTLRSWNHLIVIDGVIFPEIILMPYGEPGVGLLKQEYGITVNLSISFLLGRMELTDFRARVIDYVQFFLSRGDVFSDLIGSYDSGFLLKREGEVWVDSEKEFWVETNAPLLDYPYAKARIS